MAGKLDRIGVVRDAFLARRGGEEAIEGRQRRRLGALVAFARERSPYYRGLYAGLPARVEDPTLLPSTSKRELLAHFDDWATDREVTRARAESFVDDPERIGEPFLGSYLLASSSGTTGVRGFMVTDERALAVADALRLRALAGWLDAGELARLVRGGGRTAMLAAIHGHFTGSGIARRAGLRRRTLRLLSVLAPVPVLVDELNSFRPAILSGYASVIDILAAERDAGRLRIDPVLVASSAEALSPAEAERVARSFGAKHRSTYAAAECPFIAHSCERGWFHLNADWVMLEPVDADGGPVPAGEYSDGALLTNLANRVAPLLRYALDDRVLLRPDRCPCGSPLPAYRIEGRSADLITLRGSRGQVGIPPQPLMMLFEGLPGVDGFQIVQTEPARLRVRLRGAEAADRDRSWASLRDSVSGYLAERGLGEVALELGEEPPEQTEGGKFRKVIPLGQAGEG